MDQLIVWIFHFSVVEPQTKARMDLLMRLVVLAGRMKHCIMCVGMEDKVDLARVMRQS